MLQTYKNFVELSKLYPLQPLNLVELKNVAVEFQLSKDPVLIAVCFVKQFKLIIQLTNKYPLLDESDKVSVALEELELALIDFDISRGVKFETFFYTYLRRRLYAECGSAKCKCRKPKEANVNYDDIQLNTTEPGYGELELLQMIRTSPELTTLEISYCEIIIEDPSSLQRGSSTDIAKRLGVTSAAITYLKNKLSVKLPRILMTS